VPDALWERVQARLTASRTEARAKNNKGGRPARYLLSGLLTCASCRRHYILRNGRDYACSSHSNGRDSFCDQRRTLPKSRLEGRLLEGIKAEYLAPGVLRDLTRRVQAQLRQRKAPDLSKARAELKRAEAQIENVVDTLATVGKSAALVSRLRKLEARKAELSARLAQKAPSPQIVPNVETKVRQVIANLERVPKSPHTDETLTDKARMAIKGLLGSVVITEGVADDGKPTIFADL
jgi:site-specific DNA recombinase